MGMQGVRVKTPGKRDESQSFPGCLDKMYIQIVCNWMDIYVVAHSARHVLLYIYLVLSIVVAVSIYCREGAGEFRDEEQIQPMLEREFVYPLALLGPRVDR